MIKTKVLLVALIAGSIAAPEAWAHHSFGMFDNSKSVTIKGTAKEFNWSNPHTFIEVMVPDATTGKEVQWSIEGAPTTSLRRRGWTRNSIKAGDKVVVKLFPLRSGNPGGALDVVSINGKLVGSGAPPEAPAR